MINQAFEEFIDNERLDEDDDAEIYEILHAIKNLLKSKMQARKKELEKDIHILEEQDILFMSPYNKTLGKIELLRELLK